MTSKYPYNWRLSNKIVHSRLPGNIECADQNNGNTRFAAYVNNPELSDMRFQFPDENIEIPAHKFIVGHAGPVFQRLVYGDSSLSNTAAKDAITILECTADDFLVVLQYLYAGTVTLNVDRAIRIIRVVNFYGLSQLEQICYDVMQLHMDRHNVLDIFEHIFVLGNSELIQTCIEFIDDHLHELCVAPTNVFRLDVAMLRTLNWKRAPLTLLLKGAMSSFYDRYADMEELPANETRVAHCRGRVALLPLQNMGRGQKFRLIMNTLLLDEVLTLQQVHTYKVLQMDMESRCRHRFYDYY